MWANANNCKTPSEALELIILEKLSPYDSANAMIRSLQDKGLKPISIALYRSMLGGEGDSKHGAGFFLSTLGEENFKVSTFNRLVPSGTSYVSVTKKAPTVEELKHLLEIANLRDRALLSVLATSGMRIGEVLSRKMADIEVRKPSEKEEYGIITIRARESKTRILRKVFLTRECLGFLRAYHSSLTESRAKNSQWMFPGGEGGRPSSTGKINPGHLTSISAWDAMKDLFRLGGLNDTDDEIYSPHSMRTFCEAQLRKTELNDTYIDAILGHGIGAKKNYLPGQWDDIADEWYNLCSKRFTWHDTIEIIVKPDPHQQAKIEELTEKVNAMEPWYEALHQFLGQAGLVIERDSTTGKLKFVERKKLLGLYKDSPIHYANEIDGKGAQHTRA